MPVTWLRVKQVDETFQEDSLGRVKASRTYRAKARDPVAIEDILSASAGGVTVPALFTPWSTSRPNCFAVRRTPKRLAATALEVVVDFEDLTAGEATLVDLLAKPARLVRLSVESEMQEYTKDSGGTLVANGIGDPFDRNPERLKSDAVFHIEKYVNAAGMAALLGVHETNNYGTKTIVGFNIPEDHGLLLVEDFTPVGDPGAPVAYLATYMVKYRVDGWADEVIDVGFYEVNPDYPGTAGSEPTRPIVRGGGPVTKPWPLAADGSALPYGYDPVNDVHTLKFYPYEQDDWTGVALPTV